MRRILIAVALTASLSACGSAAESRPQQEPTAICMTAAGFPARMITSAETNSVPQSWRYGLNDLDTIAVQAASAI